MKGYIIAQELKIIGTMLSLRSETPNFTIFSNPKLLIIYSTWYGQELRNIQWNGQRCSIHRGFLSLF